MPDLRLDADVFENVKIEILRRRLKDAGVLSLFRLWCYTRKFRPSGELTRMTPEMIEIAAPWEGEPEQFISVASELILIERSDANHWRIHDWESINQRATGSKGRSENARKVNHKRWNVDRGIPCEDGQCVECMALRQTPSIVTSELTQSLNPRDETINETKRYLLNFAKC